MNTAIPPLPDPATANPATPPWNPWPYALIAYFAVFISAVIGFITWSVHQKMDLVGADYYDQEIRYQSQIDKLRRTAAMGPAMPIDYAPGRITFRLPREQVSQGVTGSVQLYRPSNAGMDRTVPLAVDSTGLQHIDATALTAGLWRIRISWKAGGEEFYRDDSLVIPR